MSGRGITIQEMEDVSRSFGNPPSDFNLSNEIGNIIDITDSSDSLGLNMLTNQAKITIGREGSTNYAPPQNTIQIPMNSQSSMGDIELAPLENIDTFTLNMDPTSSSSSIPMADIQFNRENAQTGLYSNAQTATGPSVNLTTTQVYRNPEEEKKEKMDILNKLKRLETKGYTLTHRFTMDNSLDEMKEEYTRLTDARNLEGSLKFQRQVLMSAVTGMQYMNDRFDPFDLKLEGWSESVHENVEDFDEIFEELYDKYKERGKMPPEARLVMALAGSGFMCHMSNSFLRQRLGTNGMDNVMKNNPDLVRQFAQAAANEAGTGFGNVMGMAMPQQSANGLAPQPQQQGPTGAFFGSSRQQGSAVPQSLTPQNIAANEPRATARREMKGPSNVDDILKTFEEIRRTDMSGLNGQGSFEPSAMSSGVPLAMNQPAVQIAAEMESLHSADMGSMAESSRGGGRGRKRRQPIGNTIQVNV